MKELKYRKTSLQDVQACLLVNMPVALDLETLGFYGEIRCVQFYQAHWDSALLVLAPEIIELQAVLKPLHIVCHNTSYEVSTIQAQLGALFGERCKAWVPSKWEDTLLLSKLKYFDKDKYTLDACYLHAFLVDPYMAYSLNKKAMQDAWGKGHKITEQMLQYAAIDVFYLLDLYKKCEAWVTDSNYELDKAATTHAFRFQVNGLPISKDRIAKRKAKLQAEIDAIDMPINVNSWQQVRPYIGEDESDGLALATFALQGNERAANVVKVRKAVKQISFLDKYIRESYEGRIYGKFTFTTKSGRGNCKDQNLQQLPRSTKDCFEAEEGHVFVLSDYAQLELRYGCAYTGEPKMEEAFRAGVDLHQYTADMMLVDRQYAKTCNFNLLYGGSAGMLRSIFIAKGNMLLPLAEVSSLKKKWHNLWTVLTAWQDDTTTKWRNGEALETVLGRKFKSKLYTDAMNLPISGGSAEIAKLAMHKMFKAVAEDETLRDSVKFCNFIHDSFMWECPDDTALYTRLADITAHAMKEAWEELVQYTKIPDLPMPVDVIVGRNWGDLEKGDEAPTYKLVY